MKPLVTVIQNIYYSTNKRNFNRDCSLGKGKMVTPLSTQEIKHFTERTGDQNDGNYRKDK